MPVSVKMKNQFQSPSEVSQFKKKKVIHKILCRLRSSSTKDDTINFRLIKWLYYIYPDKGVTKGVAAIDPNLPLPPKKNNNILMTK